MEGAIDYLIIPKKVPVCLVNWYSTVWREALGCLMLSIEILHAVGAVVLD